MRFLSFIHYAFMFWCTAFPVWHGPYLMSYWVFLGVTWYARAYHTRHTLPYLIWSVPGEITPSSRHKMHPTKANILPNKGHGMIFPAKSFCHVWYDTFSRVFPCALPPWAQRIFRFPFIMKDMQCWNPIPEILAWCHHPRTSTCGYGSVEFERDPDRRGQSNSEGYRLWLSSREWVIYQTHIRGTKRGRSSGRCSHIQLFGYGHRD